MNTRQEIVLRLQERIPSFQEVGGAADEHRIQNSSVRLPACFVVLLKTESEENTAINGVMQRVTEYYGVYIALENIRDERANDSMDNAKVFSKKVKKILLNWKPMSALSGLLYGGGELVSLKNNLLLWVEIYSCQELFQQLKVNL